MSTLFFLFCYFYFCSIYVNINLRQMHGFLLVYAGNDLLIPYSVYKEMKYENRKITEKIK